MTTERILIGAALILALLLAMHLGNQARKRRRELEPAEYYGDERAPELPRYRAAELHEDTVRLPTLAERTQALTALRDVCQYCGLDHVGDCAYSRDLLPAEDDYITGEIVKIIDSADDWHWSLGQWVAPARLYERLDPSDWLHELLVSA